MNEHIDESDDRHRLGHGVDHLIDIEDGRDERLASVEVGTIDRLQGLEQSTRRRSELSPVPGQPGVP